MIRAAVLRFLYDICDSKCYRLHYVSLRLDHKEFIVSKICFLIESTNGNISKAELEEYLSYSGDHLGRIFKQHKGLSISDYCKKTKLEAAKNLILLGDLSVNEIMEKLDITSRGHFYKSFKEAYGCTPKELKKQ